MNDKKLNTVKSTTCIQYHLPICITVHFIFYTCTSFVECKICKQDVHMFCLFPLFCTTGGLLLSFTFASALLSHKTFIGRNSLLWFVFSVNVSSVSWEKALMWQVICSIFGGTIYLGKFKIAQMVMVKHKRQYYMKMTKFNSCKYRCAQLRGVNRI